MVGQRGFVVIACRGFGVCVKVLTIRQLHGEAGGDERHGVGLAAGTGATGGDIDRVGCSRGKAAEARLARGSGESGVAATRGARRAVLHYGAAGERGGRPRDQHSVASTQLGDGKVGDGAAGRTFGNGDIVDVRHGVIAARPGFVAQGDAVACAIGQTVVCKIVRKAGCRSGVWQRRDRYEVGSVAEVGNDT